MDLGALYPWAKTPYDVLEFSFPVCSDSLTYETYRQNGLDCDVEIRFGLQPQPVVKAHKLILRQRSTHFRRTFGNTPFGYAYHFDFDGILPDTMELLIKYFYTGYLMIPVLPKPLLHLRIAATTLGVAEISDNIICEKLVSLLNARNCWKLREIALEAGLRTFDNHFQNWSQTNFADLFSDEEFLLASKVNDVIYMVNIASRTITPENEILECILDWVSEKEDYRKCHLFDVILQLNVTEIFQRQPDLLLNSLLLEDKKCAEYLLPLFQSHLNKTADDSLEQPVSPAKNSAVAESTIPNSTKPSEERESPAFRSWESAESEITSSSESTDSVPPLPAPEVPWNLDGVDIFTELGITPDDIAGIHDESFLEMALEEFESQDWEELMQLPFTDMAAMMTKSWESPELKAVLPLGHQTSNFEEGSDNKELQHSLATNPDVDVQMTNPVKVEITEERFQFNAILSSMDKEEHVAEGGLPEIADISTINLEEMLDLLETYPNTNETEWQKSYSATTRHGTIRPTELREKLFETQNVPNGQPSNLTLMEIANQSVESNFSFHAVHGTNDTPGGNNSTPQELSPQNGYPSALENAGNTDGPFLKVVSYSESESTENSVENSIFRSLQADKMEFTEMSSEQTESASLESNSSSATFVETPNSDGSESSDFATVVQSGRKRRFDVMNGSPEFRRSARNKKIKVELGSTSEGNIVEQHEQENSDSQLEIRQPIKSEPADFDDTSPAAVEPADLEIKSAPLPDKPPTIPTTSTGTEKPPSNKFNTMDEFLAVNNGLLKKLETAVHLEYVNSTSETTCWWHHKPITDVEENKAYVRGYKTVQNFRAHVRKVHLYPRFLEIFDTVRRSPRSTTRKSYCRNRKDNQPE